MSPSSLENMRKARDFILGDIPASPVVLDVGGRNRYDKKSDLSYARVWAQADQYMVADVEDGPNVTHLMPGPYKIPIEDEAVDVVVSGQTLEHVANPFRLVTEMRRVLRQQGFMVIIVPSAGPDHSDMDYWRFKRDAFRAISQECQMQTVRDWIYTGDNGGRRGRKWDDHVWVGRKP